MNPTLPAPEGDSSLVTRHFIPPIKIWVTLASLATATVLVRYGWLEVVIGDVIDQAVRNIITLILSFTGCLSLFIWFIRESDFQPVIKKSVTAGVVYLASDQAPTRNILCAGAGSFARAAIQESEGLHIGLDVSADDVAGNWDKISDLSSLQEMNGASDQTQKFIQQAAEAAQKKQD